MIKILVVGQTPPPFGGQAIMVKKMLDGTYDNVRLYHVRMGFSREMKDLGKIQAGKLVHLVEIIFRIFYLRITKGIRILYYPPSGPEKIPVYRDMIILLATRWMFSKTIFHFHAGGLSEIWGRLNPIGKFLFRIAFFHCDLAIAVSPFVPPDAEFIQPKRKVIIPNGVEDRFKPSLRTKTNATPPNILFVGVLLESKGVFILVEACRILMEKRILFSVDMVGAYGSEEVRYKLFSLLKEYKLEGYISFRGVLTGEMKDEIYANSDIFCFPSFFESETFGLVIVEAMQFELPVVTTKWRGIPGNVQQGVNGYLVGIKDPVALAEKLEILILDEPLRIQMGSKGREIYLQKYMLDTFYSNLNACFSGMATKNNNQGKG